MKSLLASLLAALFALAALSAYAATTDASGMKNAGPQTSMPADDDDKDKDKEKDKDKDGEKKSD